MCGLAGFCDFNKKHGMDNLVSMTDVLRHRGPNDSGYEFFENENFNLGLGHRRLSIQDLSKHGHQPMFDKTGQYIIIYNGEIYNFKEFYEELLGDGIKFNSNSDTEVILYLYIKYGDDFIKKLIGMFSIVIYDVKDQKIKVFIDRAGVKPFYYYFKNGLFAFASELKSFFCIKEIDKKIDPNALGLYFQYSYIPAPYSIFENVYKLPAGNILEFDLRSMSYIQKQYWSVEEYYNKEKTDKEYEVIKKEVSELLLSAFEYRLVSDVPVGIFLSGGYDSSAVAAILQSNSSVKLKTFSIGFDNKNFNEAPYAKDIANFLNTEHYEYYVTQKDCLELVDQLCVINDEPMGDVSSIPTYFVSKFAKEHVSVVLSGDGGDEIFGGYPKYFIGNKVYRLSSKVPSFVKKAAKSFLLLLDIKILEKIFLKLTGQKMTNFSGKFRKFINILDAKAESVFKISSQYFLKEDVAKFIKNYSSEYKTSYDKFGCVNGDYFDKSMCVDFQTYLYQILMKVDRASMAVSLESREPFLDQRIIEYLAQVPSSLKLKNGPKWILKDIVYDFIPKNLLDRPKQGFVPPFEDWLNGDLKNFVDDCSNKDFIEGQGIFCHVEVVKLKKEFYEEKKSGYKLWLFLIFQLWYKQWMINER